MSWQAGPRPRGETISVECDGEVDISLDHFSRDFRDGSMQPERAMHASAVEICLRCTDCEIDETIEDSSAETAVRIGSARLASLCKRFASLEPQEIPVLDELEFSSKEFLKAGGRTVIAAYLWTHSKGDDDQIEGEPVFRLSDFVGQSSDGRLMRIQKLQNACESLANFGLIQLEPDYDQDGYDATITVINSPRWEALSCHGMFMEICDLITDAEAADDGSTPFVHLRHGRVRTNLVSNLDAPMYWT